MKKIFTLTLLAVCSAICSFAITGHSYTCLGTNGILGDSLHTGGVWTSSNTGVATIAATSASYATVYGVSAGVTDITYTYTGGSAVMSYTVYPAGPSGIVASTTTVCPGSSIVLSEATPGGVWSSSNTAIATVSPIGLVYGVANGTVTIRYGSGTPCDATINITVATSTAGSITGPSTVCVGSSINLYDSSSFLPVSGTWSNSNTLVATLSSTTTTSCVLTGIAAGSTTVTFWTTGSCGAVYATKTINVLNTTTPATITGASSVNTGATTTLHASASGGTWNTTATTIATVGTSTGVVTGVTPGTAIISYTYTGCGAPATSTYTITVTTINGISGHVNFTGGTSYHGPVKVWLIRYNPTTMYLDAIDSVTNYISGSSSLYYQFLNPATDSYRVKAAPTDTFLLTTSYIPTYHTSSFYWHSANVIYHTVGTADVNVDINMMSGTPTTGPGFVAGYVYAGANRGTIDGLPVEGMSMNILNSATSQLVQQIRTDANGYYSFSNLPVGTYFVFPDSLNYATTAYAGITITAGAPSVTTASFNQNTLSLTITPKTTGVSSVNNAASSVIAFPNPTSGKLNVQWTVTAAENGTMVITDITGREVYTSTLNMNAGTGVKQIDLSSFNNGLYVISVKSATLNYNTKIRVQH